MTNTYDKTGPANKVLFCNQPNVKSSRHQYGSGAGSFVEVKPERRSSFSEKENASSNVIKQQRQPLIKNSQIGSKSVLPPIERSNSMQARSNSNNRLQGNHTLSKSQERLSKFWKVEMAEYEKEFARIDRIDKHETLACAEYAQDVADRLRQLELDYQVNPAYFDKHKDINKQMRAILIDWLVEVHLKFKLLPETLYVTVSIIDRFLERDSVPRAKLQLVGVTSMLIASKYEEIYAPEIRDFVYITDKAFTKEEIIEMEHRILSKLNFDVTSPSTYRFLERYHKVMSGDSTVFYLAQYLVEMTLVDIRFSKYNPSNLAASALYTSNKIMKRSPAWGENMAKYCHYDEQAVRPCAKELVVVLQNAEKNSLQAARKKFSQVKYCEVAKIKIQAQK